jgi:flagellar motor switch/type III secretory pathway protein FliN
MPLTPDLVEQVLATCRQNAGEAAAALSRTFDLPLEIAAERIGSFDYTGPAPEWDGPGLILVFKHGQEAALVLLAASSGFVPDWTNAPDATGRSKLATLAQELGAILLPAEVAADDCAAGYVESLSAAVGRGGVASGAGAIHCLLKSGEQTAALRIVWPATSPAAVLPASMPPPTKSPPPKPNAPPASPAAEPQADLGTRLQSLPSYVRSLLRISVPVSVHLATTRQPVSRVLNIGPGSIIQFEKNCEQPLTLCVGDQPVAEGEAVKVGEKFGIKLTSMVLPGERFVALRGKREAH